MLKNWNCSYLLPWMSISSPISLVTLVWVFSGAVWYRFIFVSDSWRRKELANQWSFDSCLPFYQGHCTESDGMKFYNFERESVSNWAYFYIGFVHYYCDINNHFLKLEMQYCKLENRVVSNFLLAALKVTQWEYEGWLVTIEVEKDRFARVCIWVHALTNYQHAIKN